MIKVTGTVETQSRVLVAREERVQAKTLLERLAGSDDLVVELPHDLTASVPRELAGIIRQVLEAMASGGTVTVGSMPDELTTTVAAEQLGVSRTTLMKMINRGDIAAHKVGSHHRLKTADVRAFKRARLARQRAALAELRDLEDELDAR
ncbi:helix-turn-helix domain-containing protein [Nocardioides eburneus]|uniref:helix-turn-helix domain-containing protein n=1 Tax=Nocardioides eburneus TaxID=3231482 RepID=UPI00349FBC1F